METLQNKIKSFLSDHFKDAGIIDPLVPDKPGMYCIRLKGGCKLPLKFQSILESRTHNILYIGIATKSLKIRLLNQELRHKGHGTFFRGIGAILGFFPPKGSLRNKRNQNNYKFSPDDTIKIINWINENLEVNWLVSDVDLESIKKSLIKNISPLLNTQGNSEKLKELEDARAGCKLWALA